MILDLIRHGQTAGNKARRYIGVTDEPLCPEAMEALLRQSKEMAPVDCVISSSLLRCRQTAALLYPSQRVEIAAQLQECNFGIFEGHNYQELANLPSYQQWLAGQCQGQIPGGELPAAFKERCCQGLLQVLEAHASARRLAFVVHGGTIMAVLERFALPRRDFYDWQVPNGAFVQCHYSGGQPVVLEVQKELKAWSYIQS